MGFRATAIAAIHHRAGKPPVGCAGEEGESDAGRHGQAGYQQQGGDVPKEDGHDHAVDEHGGGPEGAAFEQAAGWFFERQQEAALADAQCQECHGGGQAVADLVAAHGYHADGIGAEGYERDQDGQAATGPEQTTARRGDAAGLPGEAQLVDGKPDENR